jgi:hypothetical protein
MREMFSQEGGEAGHECCTTFPVSFAALACLGCDAGPGCRKEGPHFALRRNHHSAPVLPRGGTELILTSFKHLATRTVKCLDSADMQGKWETPAMAPSRLVHRSGNMSGSWLDTTKCPRLLREVGWRAGNTWGVARSARHFL